MNTTLKYLIKSLSLHILVTNNYIESTNIMNYYYSPSVINSKIIILLKLQEIGKRYPTEDSGQHRPGFVLACDCLPAADLYSENAFFCPFLLRRHLNTSFYQHRQNT